MKRKEGKAEYVDMHKNLKYKSSLYEGNNPNVEAKEQMQEVSSQDEFMGFVPFKFSQTDIHKSISVPNKSVIGKSKFISPQNQRKMQDSEMKANILIKEIPTVSKSQTMKPARLQSQAANPTKLPRIIATPIKTTQPSAPNVSPVTTPPPNPKSGITQSGRVQSKMENKIKNLPSSYSFSPKEKKAKSFQKYRETIGQQKKVQSVKEFGRVKPFPKTSKSSSKTKVDDFNFTRKSGILDYIHSFRNTERSDESIQKELSGNLSESEDEDLSSFITRHDVFLKSIINTLDDSESHDKDIEEVLDEVCSNDKIKDKILRYQFQEYPYLNTMKESKSKERKIKRKDSYDKIMNLHDYGGMPSGHVDFDDDVKKSILAQEWDIYRKNLNFDFSSESTSTSELLKRKSADLKNRREELKTMLLKLRKMKENKKSIVNSSSSESSSEEVIEEERAQQVQVEEVIEIVPEYEEYSTEESLSTETAVMSFATSSSREIPLFVEMGVHTDSSVSEVQLLSESEPLTYSDPEVKVGKTFLTRAIHGDFDLIENFKATFFEECLVANQTFLGNFFLKLIKSKWLLLIITMVLFLALISLFILSSFCCIFYERRDSCYTLLYCCVLISVLLLIKWAILLYKKIRHVFPSKSLNEIINKHSRIQTIFIFSLEGVILLSMFGEIILYENPNRIFGLLFPILVLTIGYLTSLQPNLVCLDTVLINLFTQFIMGYVFMRFSFVSRYLSIIMKKIYFVLAVYDYGFKQIFKVDMIACRAFHWMPIMLLVGVLQFSLEYVGVIRLIMNIIGTIVRPFNQVNHLESSISNLGILMWFSNMFQTIKHYIRYLTNSQLHLMLTILFSASPIAFHLIQMTMGIPLELSCALTLINIPGCIAISKLLYPESKTPIAINWLKEKQSKREKGAQSSKETFLGKGNSSFLRSLLNMISAGGLNSFKMYSMLLTSTITGMSIFNCLNYIVSSLYFMVGQTEKRHANFMTPFQFRSAVVEHDLFQFDRFLSWIIFPILLSIGFPPAEALFGGEVASRSFWINNIAASAVFSDHLHSRWYADCHTSFRWRHWKKFDRPHVRNGRRIYLFDKFDVNLIALPGPHFSGRSEIMLLSLISSQSSIMYSAIIIFSLHLILPSCRLESLSPIVLSASFSSFLASCMTSMISGLFYSSFNQMECHKQFGIDRNSMCKLFFQQSEKFMKGNYTSLSESQSHLSSLCYVVNRIYAMDEIQNITLTTDL